MSEYPRFKNTTILTDRQFANMGEAEHKYRNKMLRKIMTTVAIILIFVAVVSIISEKYRMRSVVCAALILAIYGVDRYCIKYRTNKERKYIQAVRGENPNIIYEFYEKYLSMDTGKSRVNINYEQIERLLKTKDLYILLLGDTSIVLAKDGFMTANRDMFCRFITEKIGERDDR